ncbi:MAG: AmmeMemoRadiSam system radical SAM enzyme [Candidatus Nanoarchaeia archaeon]
MKLAKFYKKLDSKLQCFTCAHKCIIAQNQTGICGVRINKNGKLNLLVYGQAAALAIDPIEKKPLFHFLPGSEILSFSTIGCNLRCLFCQNWEISQYPKELKFKTIFKNNLENYIDKIKTFGEHLEPKEIVALAVKNACPAIAATYTEPTIFFEYAFDVFKLAKKKGLKTVFVSNGYQSPEVIDALDGLLDAINIDLKSMNPKFYTEICGAKLKPVLENIKAFYEKGIWLELTTLLIPGKNDSFAEIKKAANFIKEISPDIPWHISAFHPEYKMLDVPPTPIETVQQAWQIGKKTGLKFVYVGNILDSEKESTYCPNCGKLLIKREGYFIENIGLEKNACKVCGEKIPGVWNV